MLKPPYAIDEVTNERRSGNLKSAKSAKVAVFPPDRWRDCNRNCGCGDSASAARARLL